MGTIRGRDFGAHESVALWKEGGPIFTVELGFTRAENGKLHIAPFSKQLPPEAASKVNCLGTIRGSVSDVIASAIRTMQSMGTYMKGITDCQAFSKRFVNNECGLRYGRLTDGGKTIVGVLTVVGIGVLAILAAVLKPRNDR